MREQPAERRGETAKMKKTERRGRGGEGEEGREVCAVKRPKPAKLACNTCYVLKAGAGGGLSAVTVGLQKDERNDVYD